MRTASSEDTDRAEIGAESNVDSSRESGNIFGTHGHATEFFIPEKPRPYQLETIEQRYRYVVVTCDMGYNAVWVGRELHYALVVRDGIRLRIGYTAQNVFVSMVESIERKIQNNTQNHKGVSKRNIQMPLVNIQDGVITAIWKRVGNIYGIGVDRILICVENVVEGFVKRLLRRMVGDVNIVVKRFQNIWRLIILILLQKEILKDVGCLQGLFMRC